jgi:hypothetical protein
MPISASADACGCPDWTVGSKRPKDHPQIEDWCNAAFSGPSSTNGSHSICLGILRYGSTNEAVEACQWFSDSARLKKGVDAANARETKRRADISAQLEADNGDENRNAPAGTAMPSDWNASSKFYSETWNEHTASSETNCCRSTVSSKVLAVSRTATSKVIKFRDYNLRWKTTIGGSVERARQEQATIPVGRHVVVITVSSSRSTTQQSSGGDSEQIMHDYAFPTALYDKLRTELSGL